VYVELEAAPWVWRVSPSNLAAVPSRLPEATKGRLPDQPAPNAPGLRVTTHTGHAAKVLACFTDEQGRVYLHCDLGFGVVHSQDVEAIADQVEAGHLQVQMLPAATLPARFAYVPSPQEQARAE
jgi:hypothetical protein